MATEVGSGFVSVVPSARGFRSKLEREIGPDTDRAGVSSGQRFGRSFSDSTGKTVKSRFATIGKVAGAGLLAGAAAAFASVRVLGGFVADARESAKIGALTNQVIKSTGRVAGVSAKHVSKLATALSNKTGIDDEVIQSSENLLLTFTNVRNEVGKGNKIFDRATGLVQDMSVALGQDAKSGAIQLGKALNDPVKGITALSRVGVSFTAQQKEQIKTLVESGRTLDAQKIILAELSKEFGGAAAAAATPMDRLRVIAGNLGESIGGFFIPYIDRAAESIGKFVRQMQNGNGTGGRFADWVRNSLVPGVRDAARFIKDDLIPALGDFARDAAEGFGGFFTNFRDAFRGGKGEAGGFKGEVKSLGKVLTDVVIPAVGAFIRETLPKLGTALGTQASFLATLAEAFVSLAVIGTRSLRLLVQSALDTFGGIVAAADKVRFLFGPVLATQIHKAAGNFDDFRDRTVGSLKDTERELKDLKAAMRDFRLGNSEQIGAEWAAGLARGIASGGKVAIATAQGVANKLAVQTREELQSRSPSRVGIKIGKTWPQGLAEGIRQASGDATQAAVDLAQGLVDKASERLDKVRGKIDDLKSTAQSLRQSVRDAVTGTLDVGSLRGGLGAMFDFRSLAARAGQFVKALATLAKRGVAPALIEQIAQAGPDAGLQAAQTLAGYSKKQLKSVNADFNQLGQYANQAARITAQAQGFPEQIDELRKIEARLEQLVRKRERDLNVTIELADESAPKTVRRKKLAASF